MATKYLARTLVSKPNAPKLVVGYSSDDVTRGLDSLIRNALLSSIGHIITGMYKLANVTHGKQGALYIDAQSMRNMCNPQRHRVNLDILGRCLGIKASASEYIYENGSKNIMQYYPWIRG